MEHHKKLLNSILSNKMDRVNVVSSLIKFGIPFQEDAQYVVLKLKLKYSLLSNMITYLKSTDCQEEVIFYERMMKETINLLKFLKEKIMPEKIRCSLIGCLFKTKRHLDYLRHLERIYPK